MPVSNRIARAVALALAALPGAVWAGKFDYNLYAGIEHSNNIALSTNNPISENVFTPGMDFTYTETGSKIQANVLGTLQYNDYLGGKFDNQTQTQVAAQANWTVLPQRLDLTVEDYAGIQPVDSLASNAPGNQQQTNVLAVGPTLHFRMGDSFRGQAELRYINSYASKVDEFNSSRGVAALRLFRDLNPTDQLSVNVETQRVNFTSNTATNSNYDRNEAYVRYTSTLARFDADVLVGGSQLNFDHSPSDSSPLARVSIAWRPTTRSTFTVSGAYQYADAAQDMMLNPSASLADSTLTSTGLGGSAGGIGTGNAVINSQVYLERRAQVSYNWRSDRLTFTIQPAYRKLHYLNDPTFDQVGKDVSLSVGYRVSPTMTLSLFGVGERLQYQTLARRDNTIRFGADLSQQWNRHWSWHASVSRERRNSNATDQSYRETQIFVGVVYRR
ncbi:uncharacterized protein (PEP-CTERM system associated) [Luteibacter rhizovicinus]|uniref:Uncharacterized protein (PEP-CTERM system associated) n=1 Tax=Luteibacter rhizovicinus TaxID=242606 RepID=A0A4R3Z079_9GAMM|nr:outer membrane beta-barrel protein [Luteibacter rhizovicinus]TCV97598.1 uncharacterized protein (PEP-CTERM system associated) [Luteibacter rhizovicinus]